jgi:3alpha(or 20beta)-hydroxysteroid dehydrogenase
MGRLDGKVALITGAARGQGEAEARHFVEEGAKVAITDVLTDQGEAVAKELGDSATFIPLDVTSEDEWASAVETAVSELGGLDVLVNNAGIATFAPITETTAEAYRRTIDVNQVGVFLGMKAVVAAMSGNGGGSIINISSIDGLIGTQGAIAYSAAKFAVRGMTKTAALELGVLGIRVNSVHPGIIETPMVEAGELKALISLFAERVPLGRTAQPEEVAKLVAFLASDESGYCTGAEFTVDGGITAGPYFELG